MKSSSFQVRLPFRTKVSSTQFRNLVRAFAKAPRPLVDPGPGRYASNFRCDLEELQHAADLVNMSRTSLARALLNGAAKITVQPAPQKSSIMETVRKASILAQATDSRWIEDQNAAPQPKAAPHAPQKSNFKSSRPTDNIQQTELRKPQVPTPVRPTVPPRPAPSPQDEAAALQRARSIPEATRIHEGHLRRQGWRITDDGVATRNKPSDKNSDGK